MHKKVKVGDSQPGNLDQDDICDKAVLEKMKLTVQKIDSGGLRLTMELPLKLMACNVIVQQDGSNSCTPETTRHTAVKKWDHSEAPENQRDVAGEATVQLGANGQPMEDEGYTQTLNEEKGYVLTTPSKNRLRRRGVPLQGLVHGRTTSLQTATTSPGR